MHTAEVGMGEVVNLNRVRKDRAKAEAVVEVCERKEVALQVDLKL